MSGYTGPLHRNPPFRAEHLGSLKRPQTLLDKRAEIDSGKADPAELISIEDASIKDIVQKQLELGYHAIGDGEYRRHMFFGGFYEGLEGFESIKSPPAEVFRQYVPDIGAFFESGHGPVESVICTSKIKHTGESCYLPQFEYIKTLVPKAQWGDIKITLAAPNWYHLRYVEGKAYQKGVYDNDDDYFADIAKAWQAEIDILYKAGVRNLQYDDPNLAYFCSEKMIAGWKEDKQNTISIEDLFDKYIKLYNACISKAPEDLHIGVHLCRGNFHNSRHFSEGGYDRIATKLFQTLNMHTYYLEYDTPRAGGFEPLANLPKNKNVILGVVTSKFPELEDKEEMKKRVYQAAEIIAKGNGQSKEEALKRLGVSPQCGFASHSEGNLIDIPGMLNKLKFVRELANEIWPNEP